MLEDFKQRLIKEREHVAEVNWKTLSRFIDF